MKAKKCDICGKLYEFKNEKDTPINGIATVYIDNGYSAKTLYDTCPECLKYICDYIENREKESGAE